MTPPERFTFWKLQNRWIGWSAIRFAVIRWRSPEGRLFLAMICVPQSLFFADQLPLQMVARSRRQSAVLAAASLVAFGAWYFFLRPGDLYVQRAAPWVLALVYLPALGVLLVGRKPAAVP